jgi:DNA-binding NarL/FixJ family response regulator
LKMISPRTRILVIHKDCKSANVFNSIKAGADVFLSEDADFNTLPEVLSTLLDDDIYLPAFVATSLLDSANNKDQSAVNFPFLLTEKEVSILKCFAAGMNLSEITDFLRLTPEVIKAHTNNILQKMHFSDIAGKYYHEIISDYQLIY